MDVENGKGIDPSMNYSSMTDHELIHYLDLYATDPLLRRLATMLIDPRGGIIADLESSGMDPKTWTFEVDWQTMYPGEYIEHLHQELKTAQDELDSVKYRLDEAETELDELKTRSIMDFVNEVWQQKRDNEQIVKEAMGTVKAFKDENEKLKEQIDMWARMNQLERKL